MIIPTPPASIKPQHTGDSANAQLPPGYSPPTEFERARLAYDGKHDYEHEWQEDYKDSTSVYSEYELEQWPREQAESLASGSSRRSAAYRASIDGGRTSSFASISPANSLVDVLLHHATMPPRLTARIRGKTAGTSSTQFDFTIDASSEVEAGMEGGRRAVLYLAEQGSRGRRGSRADSDLEGGGAGCLGGIGGEKGCAGELDESGLPAFVRKSLGLLGTRSLRLLTFESRRADPSSLADINSPGASHLHPPQLYQSLFVDVAEVLSSGLYPAAEYPQHVDTTRQHQERAEKLYRAVEEFHQSKSPFKELVCEKEVFGWDLRRVRAGLETYIRSIADVSSLDISFHCDGSPIGLRPENLISRIFSLHLIFKILLSILLIYPILLLLSYLHNRRAPPTHLLLSYPLISWRLLPPHSATQCPEELASALVKRRPTKVARLPTPVGAIEEAREYEEMGEWVALVGTMEGEWVGKCEERLSSELGRVAKGRRREK